VIYLLKQICMGSFAITSSFASLLFYGLPGLVVVFLVFWGFVVFFVRRRGALFDKMKERAKLPSRAALKLSIDSYVGRRASQSQNLLVNERNHTYGVFVEVCVMGVEETA